VPPVGAAGGRCAPVSGAAIRITIAHRQAKESDMPIYEYACKQCGHEFETLVRSGTVPDCPTCHSTELGKKLSVFATGGSAATAPALAPGPCGACGHPDGPGACALN
jgi:putative FmdB family regulatory protein